MKICTESNTKTIQIDGKSIPKFKDPKDLLKWMKDIVYGWMDDKHKKYTSFKNTKFGSKYKLLLPTEVCKYKIGICWDRALFAKHVFETQFNFEEVKYIFYQLMGNTHTFIVFKDRGEWYYFENSWEEQRGITGPYKSVEDIVKYVHKLQYVENPKFGKEYIWRDVQGEITTKFTADEFLEFVGCDFEKMNRK